MGMVQLAARRLMPRAWCVQRLRPSAGGRVLLTFDDGPHPTTTEQVLDRLRAFKARAVFFVVGNRIPRAPWMLKRIVEEGHWIGNHTFTHPLDRRMGYAEYRADLERCQEAVFDLAGCYPKFHRAPLGAITPVSLLAPKRLGLMSIHWTVSSEDWRFRADDVAIQRGHELIGQVTPSDILLFHDERPHMLKTLDILLPALCDRGVNLRPDERDIA